MAYCILLIQSYNFTVRRDHRHSLLLVQKRRLRPKVTEQVLPWRASFSESDPGKELSRVWSYGETGPAVLEDNLAFSQGWHGFMPFTPLPEGCCHGAMLSKLCWGWQFLSTWFVCFSEFQHFLSKYSFYETSYVCAGQPVTPNNEEQWFLALTSPGGRSIVSMVVLVFLHHLGLW